ncbi:hypothetical protein [Shimia sp.]|uniref:hypothetical protein n=1 Tax=Shimia sp. TaxID=1954381 RepID=UPI0035628298
MYALAWTSLRRNIALYVVVTVTVVMLELIMSAVGIVTLVFAGLAMLYTHRIVQLGERHGWADPLSTTGKDGGKVPIIGYLLRFLAIFVALMLVVSGGFMALEAATGMTQRAPDTQSRLVILGVALVVPALAAILAAIGTVLPACAERADTSLRSALARGRKTFGRTFLDLLIGPVALALAGSLLLGQIGWLLGGLEGWPPRILHRIAATILTILPAILAATALSRAYLAAQSR